MNEESAIHPAAIRSVRDVYDLVNYFGPYRGRFVCAYPSDWRASILEGLNGLPEFEAKRCKEALKKYKKHFLRTERAYSRDDEWHENARRVQASSQPFHEVFSDSGSTDEFLDFAFVAMHTHGSVRSMTAIATAENHTRAASVLLRYSPKISLIDPYALDNGSKFAETLNHFLWEIGRTNRCKEITIITQAGRDRAEEAFHESVNRLRDQLKKSLLPPLGVRILELDGSGKAKGVHFRFLLSELGALKFDRGFSCIDKTNLISYEDEATHQALMPVFLDGPRDLNQMRESGYPVLHDCLISAGASATAET